MIISDRPSLFVSHAYPEDNVFAEWLMSQLRVAGFEPWLDLTHLSGGERIWPEAELAIRNKAFRFLFVLSKHSNSKRGTGQELSLATKVGRSLQLKDFVIPLAIDDLHPDKYNIELTELLPIEFSASWATGLHSLLTKLERLEAPRTSSPAAAAQLWRVRMEGVDRIQPVSERVYSNQFPILSVPPHVYAFHLATVDECRLIGGETPTPTAHSGRALFSFIRDGATIHPSLGSVEPSEFAVTFDHPPRIRPVGARRSRRLPCPDSTCLGNVSGLEGAARVRDGQ